LKAMVNSLTWEWNWLRKREPLMNKECESCHRYIEALLGYKCYYHECLQKEVLF